MLTQLARFDLPDLAAAAAFDALVAATVPVIRAQEPGTLTYDPYTVTDEPLARVFFEVYTDDAAHDEHMAQPHTAAFLAEVRRLVTGVRIEKLTAA